MINDLELKFLEFIWEKIKPHCVALYTGGSFIDPVIDFPHDHDYIIFIDNDNTQDIRDLILKIYKEYNICAELRSHKLLKLDLSQIRNTSNHKTTGYSYLDHYKTKVFGEDVPLTKDILGKDKLDFIADLKIKAELLKSRVLKNPKRGYHILRGCYIILNNSYEVTAEQKAELNLLHQLKKGGEKLIPKICRLLEDL